MGVWCNMLCQKWRACGPAASWGERGASCGWPRGWCTGALALASAGARLRRTGTKHASLNTILESNMAEAGGTRARGWCTGAMALARAGTRLRRTSTMHTSLNTILESNRAVAGRAPAGGWQNTGPWLSGTAVRGWRQARAAAGRSTGPRRHAFQTGAGCDTGPGLASHACPHYPSETA